VALSTFEVFDNRTPPLRGFFYLKGFEFTSYTEAQRHADACNSPTLDFQCAVGGEARLAANISNHEVEEIPEKPTK
jgi:hypothetical protein